jgi:hypothetical protein
MLLEYDDERSCKAVTPEAQRANHYAHDRTLA